MVRKDDFTIPDELTMLEIVGSEPVDAAPKDGYWSYEITDELGIKLRLSFNVVERWLRTEILVAGQVIQMVEQEGAVLLADWRGRRLPDNPNIVLRGECHYENAKSTLDISIKPNINIYWATLIE